jgi:hypothetical protein
MKKNKILILSSKKQLFTVFIMGFMMCSLGAQASHVFLNNDVLITYSFESPSLETVDIGGVSYDRVTLTDCYPAGSAGEPKLPSKGVFLLLPPFSEVSDIVVTPGEKIVLSTDVLLEPTSQAIPLSQTEDIPIPVPNPVIYQSNDPYPGTLFTSIGTQNFRGYQILVLLLHPVQYIPATGELYYYTNLEVHVQTIETTGEPALYRGYTRDSADVQDRVDNPEMTLRYSKEYSASPASFDDYDLLVITTDALRDGFEPLKDAHDATGIQTVIKTLTDIGGSDLESIRNYIRDAYTNWGIDYVLIGGDTNVVAAPMLWVSGMDENTTYYEETMPSDIYYACLDGPYNGDGDGQWGEPNDGEGGGDVDLIAEVYVGRACVGNTAEVNNFVTKTVAYINKDPNDPFFKKATFAAEYLGNYGIASYGSSYMNQLINGSSDDGYTTVGISSEEYVINTLYDSPGYDWPSSAIVSIINNGVHFINHLGHASYEYNMKLDNYDVDGLNNPSNRTCFIYSQGCYAGGFDDNDCIAEHFTIKTTHAAFAGIWNARYGFFWSESTDGDSQRFHRQFWDAVFGEMKPEIGRANHDSKEDNLPIIGRSCIRWVYYETNLFGDPTLALTDTTSNNPPQKPAMPSGPTSGSIGVNYTFSSVTTDPDAGDLLYYMWDWGNGVSSWLGPYSSGQPVQTEHYWTTEGQYDIKVKAKDSVGVETSWSDPLTVQIISGPSIEIESISGGFGVTATIANAGVVDATDVNWTIALQGLVFFGKQQTGNIEKILPGFSPTISSGLVFGFGSVDITVTAADAEKTVTGFLLGPFVLNVR